jgi:hypothetical protein
MSKTLLAIALIVLLSASCAERKQEQSPQPAAQAAVPAPAPVAKEYTGAVAETMNASNYTYVLLDTGSEKLWFAGPACAVNVGDRLTVNAGMLKENFSSKTLGRTFEKIYFTEAIMAPEGARVCAIPQQQAGMTPIDQEGVSHAAAPAAEGVDFSGIKKPAGAKTVAELFQAKKELAGKKVTLVGKVVKFNPEIMGKNWLHVQDGTGSAGSNDITVTTKDTAAVGDTIVAEGVLQLDKDFGYGYKYAVIIEDAQVKKQ